VKVNHVTHPGRYHLDLRGSERRSKRKGGHRSTIIRSPAQGGNAEKGFGSASKPLLTAEGVIEENHDQERVEDKLIEPGRYSASLVSAR